MFKSIKLNNLFLTMLFRAEHYSNTEGDSPHILNNDLISSILNKNHLSKERKTFITRPRSTSNEFINAQKSTNQFLF